jgi:bacterioferritin (cytochrome b1)
MDTKKIIEGLNRMLEQENACAIRYETHAAVVAGPYAQPVSARLKEIAADEREHAEKLRGRIAALGGTPSMQVSSEDLKPAATLDKILKINIAEEHAAISGYTKIFEGIEPRNVILYQTIQEIIRDEQEHLEELETLQSSK